MPSKSESKSSKDKQPPQQMPPPMEPGADGEQVWVPSVPRLPHIETQPQYPEMGRRSEVAFCKGCGTIAPTVVKWLKGAQAWYWSCLAWHCVLGGCLICFLGVPGTWAKEFCWDANHFCVNCSRKLGYNCYRKKWCCYSSSASLMMPAEDEAF